MRLKKLIKLKHKLLLGLVFTYIFLILLGLISFKNLNYQIFTAENLNQNIILQNGIINIKEYLQNDLEYMSSISKSKTEQELDNVWFEHEFLIKNIEHILDSLHLLKTGQSDEIEDIRTVLNTSIVDKQKNLYKEKIRQIIQNQKDSALNISNQGLAQEIVSNINYLKDSRLAKIEKEIKSDLINTIILALDNGKTNKLYLVLILIIGAIVYVAFIYLFVKIIFKSLEALKAYILKLKSGDLSSNYNADDSDEIGRLGYDLNNFAEKVKEISSHLNDIGEANFENSYELLSEKDELGKAFLKMKKSLQLANEEAKKLKEQEDLQNWATIGIAKFGEILRQQTNSNEELAYNIIKALIEYIDANQGGLFIVNDEGHETILELMATYAYGRKKFKQKTVRFGEGLVGTCALEAQTIHMTNIPEDYIEIESYLGHSNPKSLLIVPLKLENKLFGIIEIASFNEYKNHEIKFIEDLAETIASTLSTAKINAKTAELLEISKQQSEAMLAQEEEMRQNLEELQSTQEEAARRERVLQEDLEKAQKEIISLKLKIDELKK